MRILGIDPGDAHSGWAYFVDGKLTDQGQINVNGKLPWSRRLPLLHDAFARIIREKQPEAVAIEKTQMGGGKERTAAQAYSQAARTRNTEELAGIIAVMAARIGADVVRVTAQGSLNAIGCRHGASDRETVEAFTRMFGKKLLVKDNHEARAAGVAMRGEVVCRIDEAKRGDA